ncbi:hypothetical protein VTK73DRAFT_6178 [Phialemonium thermophilum]|uniref:Uncharacterized protein n=1 Tax=Phialemonium thermophilum TaxID=223376 RepID=A0ABR3WKA2_9PEZI
MDSDSDAEPTQQATQNVLDPRRLGKQKSGFTDEELADIICLLIPCSEYARREVARIAQTSSQHMVTRDDADIVDLDFGSEDEASRFGVVPQMDGEHVIALRLSARVKDPLLGFTFGRNASRCDITFQHDPYKRLSNIHFRIYLNHYGILMLEDQSTNGTIVDKTLLKFKSRRQSPGKKADTKRVLTSGSIIQILMHTDSNDLRFLVRIPRREGQYEQAYINNQKNYLRRLRELAKDANTTIGPGPEGHVDLFPNQADNRGGTTAENTSDHGGELLRKAWSGSDKYHRVAEIGKGAFATVYQVTDKYNGIPYAAKELDKRKFMKNGVLDQKVENEMNIMQRIQHPNIVRYIEHLDVDSRLLIIIMEYVNGGDLGRLIGDRGCLSEEATKTMAAQLLDALAYLHSKNITHRDVKPDNILISSQQPFVVKLTDFGLSKMVDNQQTFLRTFCGTLLYCAPEVYSEFAEYDEHGRRNPRNRHRKQPQGQRYDHAVDIWSLGGVLFYALTGSPPFPVRAGTSYSELLHRIMTTPLDITPLQAAGISLEGIDFVQRMLERWPQRRAPAKALWQHPWLDSIRKPSDFSQSYDEICDEDLENRASQLSIGDENQPIVPLNGAKTMDFDDFSFDGPLSDYEMDKENQTFGPGQQPLRLFGEVNASAIGSSGVIPEDRLNLPVSDASICTTELLEVSEIRDSFESQASSTLRQPSQKGQKQPPEGALLSSIPFPSESNLMGQPREATFDGASQSLGGAESIMGNLNMRSMAGSNLLSVSQDGESFTSSKRKTFYNSSDDSQESSPLVDKPSIKRIKSDVLLDRGEEIPDDEWETELLAYVPPVARARSARQVDRPVEKSVYWNPQDRKTWHLRYPEMTKFQLDAFEAAATARGEEFGPGKTPLWELAMKYFPPAHYEEVVSRVSLDVEKISGNSKALKREDHNLDDMPPTAHPQYDDDSDLPSTLKTQMHRVVPVEAKPPGKRIVASLLSSTSSLIQGLSIFITESMLSWGRAAENTCVYEQSKEVRVPKYAFRILLWKEGYDPSRDFRPWNQKENATGESFHFYISTKATQGVYVNGVLLPSHDCKNPTSPSKYWMRLHDGDEIVVWRNRPDTSHSKTELIFRCAWGGSSLPRAPASASYPQGVPTLALESVARSLDEVCVKTEKKMKNKSEYDFKMEESHNDHDERMQATERERERSRIFELRRQAACRLLAASRGSRRTSPASAPAATSGVPTAPMLGGGGGGGNVFGSSRMSTAPAVAKSAQTVPSIKRP